MHDSHEKPPVRRRFRIVDALTFTGIVAVNFAAYQRGASYAETGWSELLCFTPTAITCLVHLRLRLSTAAAMVVHYSVFLTWSLLHSIGRAVSNNPYMAQEDIQYSIDWGAYLWREASGMALVGIAWAAAYGLICYTALHANRTDANVEQRDRSKDAV